VLLLAEICAGKHPVVYLFPHRRSQGPFSLTWLSLCPITSYSSFLEIIYLFPPPLSARARSGGTASLSLSLLRVIREELQPGDCS